MEPLWISLLAAVASVLIALTISALAAWVRFSAKPSLRWALDILFLLQLAFSPFTLVYIACRWFAHSENIAFVMESIAALPLFYFCAILGFRKVAPETMDAARLQGLGRCGIFWRVFFPPAWPWLAAGLGLGLVRSLILLALLHA